MKGFRNIRLFFRDGNLGLSKSIIIGVSEILTEFPRVIVLEDDLTVSPYFLRFMNQALDRYDEEPRVASICGYTFPIETMLPESYFIRGADCWGWATWRRGWEIFSSDGARLLEKIRSGLSYDFDYRGAYPFTKVLEDQVTEKNDSWAIRWQAALFIQNKLTLYPGRSLVQNLGFDSSGAHCGTSSDFDVTLSESPIQLCEIPIEENEWVLRQISRFFRKISSDGSHSSPVPFMKKAVRFLRRLWRKRQVRPLRRTASGKYY
jgi:hypothetical protein